MCYFKKIFQKQTFTSIGSLPQDSSNSQSWARLKLRTLFWSQMWVAIIHLLASQVHWEAGLKLSSPDSNQHSDTG